MGKPSTALKLLLSLLSLAVVLGAMEGILRYRDPRSLRLTRGRKPVPFRVAHPVYGHALLPGATGRTSHYGEYDVPYKINSLGLREREVSRKIPPGTVRLLILGDSFTEGFGVKLEDAFVKILERRLNASPARPGVRYETVNMGVASFSPLLEYLFLKETLGRIEGDFLVLNLDASDFSDDNFYERGARWGPGGEPLAVSHGDLLPNYLSYGRHFLETLPAAPWRNSWVLRFLVWHFIRRVHGGWVRSRLGRIEYDRYGWTRPGRRPGDAWEAQLGRSFGYILRIRELLKKKGIGFAVALYPHGHQVHPRAWCAGRERAYYECGKVYGSSLFAETMALCRKSGLTCWDLTPDFRRPDADSLFYNVDEHFNAKGNAVMAGALEKRLRPLLARMAPQGGAPAGGAPQGGAR